MIAAQWVVPDSVMAGLIECPVIARLPVMVKNYLLVE
jgi:hypothetical protein